MVNPDVLISPKQKNYPGYSPALRDPQDFLTPRPTLRERFSYRIFAAEAVPTILIIDASHWNGDLDPALLRASGVVAVIIKCSEAAEGTYYEYKDTKFEENWRKLLDAGFPVMLYHFFRGEKGNAEFSWFMKCADAFLNDERINGNTAIWLDCEWKASAQTRTQYANRAFAFCYQARDTGFRQGIYSSPGLVPQLFPSNETRWGDVFQWNAHWTYLQKDTLPAGWSEALRLVWQFGIHPTHSWTPEVNGAGTVDVNWGYWESEEALREWMGQEIVVPPPVDCCEDHELRIATLEAGQQVLTEIQELHGKRLNDHANAISVLNASMQSMSERVDNHDYALGQIRMDMGFTNQQVEYMQEILNKIHAAFPHEE